MQAAAVNGAKRGFNCNHLQLKGLRTHLGEEDAGNRAEKYHTEKYPEVRLLFWSKIEL
jgi:hypothetical protein